MSEATPIVEQVCPDCGATYPITAKYCWMCYRPLGRGPEGIGSSTPIVAQSAAGESPFATGNQAMQFGLSTVMLTITLVAVLLGVAKLAPGLGVLLALVVLPAYLRTCIAASRRSGRGQPMSTGAKLGSFGLNLCIVVVVAIAVIVAGVVALLAVCFSLLS